VVNALVNRDYPIRDYCDVGHYSMGRIGLIMSQFSVYSTLFGAGVVFLILIGVLMTSVISDAPASFWTLLVGVVVLEPICICFKTFTELKIISYFGFLATTVVVLVAAGSSIAYRCSSSYKHDRYNGTTDYYKTQWVTNFHSEVTAFSVFTFAFGATAVFPNIYQHMAEPHLWSRSVNVGYLLVTTIVLPLAVFAYIAYGNYLSNVSTILEALSAKNGTYGSVVSKFCSLVMVFHILAAFPLLINPVFRFFELSLLSGTDGSEPSFVFRSLSRSVLLAVLILLGIVVPYFLEVMGLISSISLTISGYILPCLFYFVVCRPSTPHRVLCVLIIVFGIAACGVGSYSNTVSLIDAIRSHQNPFSCIFYFGDKLQACLKQH